MREEPDEWPDRVAAAVRPVSYRGVSPAAQDDRSAVIAEVL